MSNEQKPSMESQKCIAHLQCSDGDFRYTAERIDELLARVRREARAEAFEEAAAIVRDADLTMDRRRILLKIIAAKESAS